MQGAPWRAKKLVWSLIDQINYKFSLGWLQRRNLGRFIF